MVTLDFLSERLRYDANSGKFLWLKCGRTELEGQIAGGILRNKRGPSYRRICVAGKNYWAHRLAWFFYYGEWPKSAIDHINGDTDDNRICNLREATNSQNAHNSKTPKNNTSGIKGVYAFKRLGLWAGCVTFKGKTYYAGYHKTKESAAEAVREIRLRLHSEFANHG